MDKFVLKSGSTSTPESHLALSLKAACPVTSSSNSSGSFELFHVDSPTVELSGAGTLLDPLRADAIISSEIGNMLTENSGLYVPGALEDGIRFGGIRTWVENYTYNVSAAGYVINGSPYTSPQTQVTLDPADILYDRIDSIVVDINGNVVVITGEPAENPQEPSVDPETQLLLGFVIVTANTTEPVVIPVQDWIYINNVEWTTAPSTVRIDAASINNPVSSPLSVEATNVLNGDFIDFTRSSALVTSEVNVLNFEIRSKASWVPVSGNIQLRFYNGVNPVGTVATLSEGTYGYTSTITGSSQNISIPLTSFGSIPTVDRLRITVGATAAMSGFYLDNIQLQEAFIPAGTGNFILNQYAFNQPANWKITGVGSANALVVGGSTVNTALYKLGIHGNTFISGTAPTIRWSNQTLTLNGVSSNGRLLLTATGTGAAFEIQHTRDNGQMLVLRNAENSETTKLNFAAKTIATLTVNGFTSTQGINGYYFSHNLTNNSSGWAKGDVTRNAYLNFFPHLTGTPTSLIKIEGLQNSSTYKEIEYVTASARFVSPQGNHRVIIGSSTDDSTTPLQIDGIIKARSYGDGLITGIFTKYLAVDVDGKIIEVDPGVGGEVISADNGLTENVPGNVQLGGTLLASTTIATVANTLTISTATASINPLSVLAGTGTALVATSSGGLATVNVTNSSSGFGIQATGTTNAAIFATSTGGSGISAFSTNALAGEFVINPASTNSIVEAVRIVRNTSGTASNSIGLSVDMYNETDSGTIRVTNQIISKLTTAADAARVSQFILTGVDNAVTADLFALSGNGSLQLNKYGVGLFTTGVPIYNLSVTSTGQVIETLPGAAGEIISADNGLTENVPGNVQLGGTLINATTTVAGGTNVMQFTTSNGGLFEYSFGTFSASNTANTAALTSSSTDGVAGIFDVNPATTNTVVNSVYVRRLTSGTAANNIGVGLQFVVENSIGSTVNSNQFVSQLTNVTSGSETSRFILRGINSSVSVDALTILGSGSTRLNSYGVGTFTGTAAYTLQVDASGNIIEGSLSGSTNIYNSDGSLTANRTVTNAGFSLTVNNNTATTTLAVNNTSTGIALSGTSTSNIGVNGVSTNQQGVVGTSSSSYGVWGVSTSSIGGVFNVNPSSTNTIVEAVRLLRATSGTAANGIGAYLGILAENSDGTSNEIAKVAAAWTDVTVGTRTGDLQFWTTNSATSAVKMTIAGSGTVTLHGVNYTGLGAGYLAVDNAGVLSWNAGTGGASNVYTADGTLTGNRTMTLSGNTFRALQATEEYFLIDPTANNEAVLLQAINTTGSNNTAFYSGLTTASDGTASIGTTFNGTNIGRVQTFSDTSGSLNTYVATAHEFTGNVRSSANNTDDLGSASISWKDIYTRTVKFDGSTSGTVTIQAAAVAGTPTITLPTVTGTMVEYFPDTTASSATPTPTGDRRQNFYDVTALAANATIAAPSGTAINGNMIMLRIKDNGVARTLAFNAIYRAGTDIAFPTTTVVGETMYLQFVYNSADTKWDFVGLTQGF